MRKHVTLITGAGGEIGHGLIERLAADSDGPIITIDLKPLDPEIRDLVEQEYVGSILETHLLERILSEYLVDTVYHLAAILSTRAEFTPVTGHEINVEGTLKLLDFAQAEGESHGRPVAFLYPSSIAAYGLPDLETKAGAGAIREHEWNHPTTMYGCNKLYCELLGRYYARHYKQLAAETLSGKVDFRAIRFPGLISAVTVPSGGTSDYAPEMIHAAARGEPYECFVRPDTQIPFMVMSDAVDSLVKLARADTANLTKTVYNITAFNPTAAEIRELVLAGFPEAGIEFVPDLKRQAILDTWPADVDDSAARTDWGLAPRFDLEHGFADFLIPEIRERYRSVRQ
jgi:nucleoside-diphosphate-sugar epimerase